MNNNFGPNSTNPRQRRAYAHAVIGGYRKGEVSYAKAFDATYRGSQAGEKGERSNFGAVLGALGGVFVDAYAQVFPEDRVVVSGLSASELAKTATEKTASYRPDVYMVRPGAHDTPELGDVIRDPIAEGFVPLEHTASN